MPCFLQVIAKMLPSEDSQMCPRNTVSTLAFNIQKRQRGTRRGSFCSCRIVEQTQFITDRELEWVKIKLLKII